LLDELPKLKQYLSQMIVCYTPTDMDTFGVLGQYMPLLARSGINPIERQMSPRGPEDQGLIIAVPENKQIPQSALAFQQILRIADISAKIVPFNPGVIPQERGSEFAFFVAPAPIN
jgi:hypothetical protein